MLRKPLHQGQAHLKNFLKVKDLIYNVEMNLNLMLIIEHGNDVYHVWFVICFLANCVVMFHEFRLHLSIIVGK